MASTGSKLKLQIKPQQINGLDNHVKSLLFSLFIAVSLSGCETDEKQPPILRIAVASNFQVPMSALINEFQIQYPLANISMSSASSGVLLSQIKRGAPFELFFSADSERPLTLAEEFDLPESVHTYAIGRLVLWAPNLEEVTIESITQLDRRIAIAQPELAPYGLATRQVLKQNGMWEDIQPTIAYGNNVTQVEHFIKTGAVAAGFLSLAQVKHSNVDMRHIWLVPTEHYEPIEQKVILLNQKAKTELSKSFLDFVLSEQGQTIISRLGYGVVNNKENAL